MRSSRRALMGLSPHLRGSQLTAGRVNRHIRSIPAHKGELLLGVSVIETRTVYPSAYGGAPPTSGEGGPGGGLSPRIRGSLPRAADHPAPLRSIPAHKGEPSLPQAW